MVDDTTYGLPGLHRHHARIVEGTIEPGQEATAAIDVERRDAIRRNHTGTHVLHWALRKVLGENVKQQGSLVDPDRLRFDFGPSDALTPAQIQEIEDLANAEILANDPVRHYETTKAEAANLGAIAFFGDKYGDIVRVLEAGRHSIELCGGTHVRALGDIGPVKIVSESSIGANLRRIEAVTGTGPIERLRAEERRLAELAEVLNVPVGEVVDGARKRLDEIKALRDEIKVLKRQAAGDQASTLAAKAVDGVIVERVDGLERDTLRDIALALRDKDGLRAVVLATAPEGGGAALVAAVTPDSGLDASGAARGGQEADQGRRRQGPAPRGGRRQGRRRHRRRPRQRAGGGRHRRLVRALGLDLGSKRIGVALSTSRRLDGHALRGGRPQPATGPATTAPSPRWPRRPAPSSWWSGSRCRSTAPTARPPRAARAEADELGRGHRPARSSSGTSASPPSPPTATSWPSTSTPRPAAGLSTRWPRRSCCRPGSTTAGSAPAPEDPDR